MKGMIKNGLLLTVAAVAIVMLVSPVKADSPAWLQSGDSVYINDSKAFIMASPHTVTGDSTVTINATAKNFTGNIDVMLGFDTDNVKPVSAKLYSPHVHTVQKSYTCEYPNRFNYTLSPKVAYCWWNNSATNSSLIERLVYSHSFTSADAPTIYWSENVTHEYTDVSESFTKVNYDYGGMDTWYYKTDVPFTKGVGKMLKLDLRVPITLGANGGKYWVCMKPSSQSFAQAIAAGNLYCLDPWWNTSWNHYKNFTLTEQNYLARVNEPVNVNVTGIHFASTDELRLVDDSGTERPYVVVSNTTTSAYIKFQANVSKNAARTFSVFYDNVGAAKPSYAPDVNLTMDANGNVTNAYYNFGMRKNNYDYGGGLKTVSYWWDTTGAANWESDTVRDYGTIGPGWQGFAVPTYDMSAVVTNDSIEKTFNQTVTIDGQSFNTTLTLYANYPYAIFTVEAGGGSMAGGLWHTVLTHDQGGTTQGGSLVKNDGTLRGFPGGEGWVDTGANPPRWLWWNETGASGRDRYFTWLFADKYNASTYGQYTLMEGDLLFGKAGTFTFGTHKIALKHFASGQTDTTVGTAEYLAFNNPLSVGALGAEQGQTTADYVSWSGNQTTVPQNYSSGSVSQFNITWTSAYGTIDTVLIEGNWSGTAKNYTATTTSTIRKCYNSIYNATDRIWYYDWDNGACANAYDGNYVTYVSNNKTVITTPGSQYNATVFAVNLTGVTAANISYSYGGEIIGSPYVASNFIVSCYNYSRAYANGWPTHQGADAFSGLIYQAYSTNSIYNRTDTVPADCLSQPLQIKFALIGADNETLQLYEYSLSTVNASAYLYSDILPAGGWYWKSYANDSAGTWNTSDTWGFRLNPHDNPITLEINNGTSRINTNVTATYGASTTATATNATGTTNLYRNGSLVAQPETNVFGGGTYEYIANVTASANYSANSTTVYLDVLAHDNPIDITINNGTSYKNQNVTITYGTFTNASALNVTAGLSDLFRNGAKVSNPEYNKFGGGTYTYISNFSGNANYTANSTWVVLTVNRAPITSLKLYLNKTEANLTTATNAQVNITGISTPTQFETNITIWKDMASFATGSDSGGASGNVIVNYSTITGASGYAWNITATMETTQNYSAPSAVTRWINIDSTAPIVTLVSPSNASILATNALSLTVSTNEAAECRYGTSNLAYANMTALSAINASTHGLTFVSMLWDNTYTYWIKCNDTTGNLNNTPFVLAYTTPTNTGGGTSGGGGGGGSGHACGDGICDAYEDCEYDCGAFNYTPTSINMSGTRGGLASCGWSAGKCVIKFYNPRSYPMKLSLQISQNVDDSYMWAYFPQAVTNHSSSLPQSVLVEIPAATNATLGSLNVELALRIPKTATLGQYEYSIGINTNSGKIPVALLVSDEVLPLKDVSDVVNDFINKDLLIFRKPLPFYGASLSGEEALITFAAFAGVVLFTALVRWMWKKGK